MSVLPEVVGSVIIAFVFDYLARRREMKSGEIEVVF